MLRASLICVALFVAVGVLAAPTPSFPNQYLVSGVFSIPYFNITEPLRVVYDGVNHRERIDYYHGMDTFIYTPATNYEVVPRITTRICMENPGSPDSVIPMIPDVTQAGWNYQGTADVNGKSCHHFQQLVKNENQTSTYDFYYTVEGGFPVQLVMMGYDFVFGSHPDLYILDYHIYIPNYQGDKDFVPPDLCKTATRGTGVSASRNAALLRSLMPYKRDVKNVFAHHVNKFGRNYDAQEYSRRQDIFAANLHYIDHYNMKTALRTGITLAPNHYADMEHHEYRRVMLPKKGHKAHNGAQHTHRPSGAAPDSIDWRQLGAVTMVKDQGACGSCWTFGTTGTLEGTYFVKHGSLPSLSEQQVVDCAWGDRYLDSMGCDGGQTAGALQWVMDNGGIATESSYRYLMQDGYCHNDTSSGVRVASYTNVTMGDEEALKDAIGTMGPVAVAIDAAHTTFEFYSSGVFYEPSCKNGFNDLDHEVLAVGYGTENGQDYWIIKNSWSTHWGDQGYIKMARNRNNNCGVATDAVYPNIA